jgi:23S rRNA pseudouridine1911/1915/1917 synthase
MAIARAVVEQEASGMRLDVFATRHFCATEVTQAGLSRSRMQRLIAEGHIMVNGLRAKANTRLKPGDLVELVANPSPATSLRPEAAPLNIIYEDDEFLVLNKGAGMVVHPAAGNFSGTLVNALLHRYPQLEAMGGHARPGIVHRLDKDTSGAMVVAKNELSLQDLARQFKDRTVQKEYIAVVWGKPAKPSGIIDRPIGRHRSQRKKMSSRFAHSRTREALTEWKVERIFPLYSGTRRLQWVSVLRLKPRTGRTHQIRVHLADLGHPLIGDKVYGTGTRSGPHPERRGSLLDNFSRQALHAEILAFNHRKTGCRMEFKAPIAQDLIQLIMELEKQSAETSKGVDKEIRFY